MLENFERICQETLSRIIEKDEFRQGNVVANTEIFNLEQKGRTLILIMAGTIRADHSFTKKQILNF